MVSPTQEPISSSSAVPKDDEPLQMLTDESESVIRIIQLPNKRLYSMVCARDWASIDSRANLDNPLLEIRIPRFS